MDEMDDDNIDWLIILGLYETVLILFPEEEEASLFADDKYINFYILSHFGVGK